MDDPTEWEFGVPASQVDLGRLLSELHGIPTIYQFAYIDKLKEKAPTVYGRLAAYLKENGAITGWDI